MQASSKSQYWLVVDGGDWSIYHRRPILGENNVARYPDLQLLVAIAGLDDDFCKLLLQGNREQAIQDLNLTNQEQLIILAIIADSLPTFAQDLEGWMLQNSTLPASSTTLIPIPAILHDQQSAPGS